MYVKVAPDLWQVVKNDPIVFDHKSKKFQAALNSIVL